MEESGAGLRVDKECGTRPWNPDMRAHSWRVHATGTQPGKDACTMRIWYRHNIWGLRRGIIHGGPVLVDRDEI